MATLDETKDAISTSYNQASEDISGITQESSDYVAPTLSQAQEAGAVAKTGTDYVTSDMTVQGQLVKLLSSDSDYLKQVDAKSKITASELGMLSSDRYIGAATGAAIRESLPIATADASTYSKFGLQQQQAENTLATTKMEGLVSGALKTQEADINQKLQKTQGLIESYIKSADAKTQASMAQFSNDLNLASNSALKILENQLTQSLLSREYDEKTAENTRAQAVSQIENTMISVENILKDPDMLQLGSAAVAQTINNQINMMRTGIELTYNLAGLNVDGYVSDLLDSFQDTYEWSALG